MAYWDRIIQMGKVRKLADTSRSCVSGYCIIGMLANVYNTKEIFLLFQVLIHYITESLIDIHIN